MSNAGADSPSPQLLARWQQLELTVASLLDALDDWRRRAHAAEQRVAELERTLDAVASGELDPSALARTIDELSRDNQDLRLRLDSARDRVQRLLHRLDFLQEARSA
jgi:chromosome segregation ATPase